MFYEVKVLDPKGKLIKKIPGKELNKRYWKGFFESTSKIARKKPGRKVKKADAILGEDGDY